MHNINEDVINKILSTDQSVAELIQHLSSDLHLNKYTKQDKQALLNFIIQSGHTLEAMHILNEWPNKEHYFPWDIFFSILIKKDIALSDQEFDVITNFLQVNAIPILYSENFFQLNSKFQLKIKEQRDTLNYEASNKIKLLWDQLEIIQNKNLMSKEQTIISQLKMSDSKNHQLKKYSEALNLKLSLNLNAIQNETLLEDFSDETKLSLEEVKLCQNIYAWVLDHVNDGDKSNFDYAVMFYQLSAFNFSLSCINRAPNTNKKKWLHMELLFFNSRYFECIEYANTFFIKYPENKDVQFSSAYLKAQALKAIGNQPEAIELMQTLVDLQPNYRSSYQLLQDWKKEAH